MLLVVLIRIAGDEGPGRIATFAPRKWSIHSLLAYILDGSQHMLVRGPKGSQDFGEGTSPVLQIDTLVDFILGVKPWHELGRLLAVYDSLELVQHVALPGSQVGNVIFDRPRAVDGRSGHLFLAQRGHEGLELLVPRLDVIEQRSLYNPLRHGNTSVSLLSFVGFQPVYDSATGLVFADGKSGLGYLLHAARLGGVGGQAQVMPICRSRSGAAALSLMLLVPCNDGLRQVLVGPGASLHLGWHTQSSINGSPIVGGHTVYSVNHGGTLYALDVSSGSVRATLAVGAASIFTTPTLSGNLMFVGTFAEVVAATIS